MKFLLVVGMIALTILCWGAYGPVLHHGKDGFQATGNAASVANVDTQWRPLMCVGLAYFVIAVMSPLVMLSTYGEKGLWTASGLFWSLLAGAFGAIGALGVILAFGFGGRPVFVMPLVFGGAPVVIAFVTIYMSKSFRNIGPFFLAGLIILMIGAVMVLIFKPGPAGGEAMNWKDLPWVLGSIAVVILTWGAYGPVLHKGQLKMGGSRLRPLICVGLAYFLIAVIVPALMLGYAGVTEHFSWPGSLWSLGAGAAGAIGALGIIMAFNFGGKPIYVMPLVFGGAPVVNTFTSMIGKQNISDLKPVFLAGLILVVAGAAIVLVFAPKGESVSARPKKKKVQEERSKTEKHTAEIEPTAAAEGDSG